MYRSIFFIVIPLLVMISCSLQAMAQGSKTMTHEQLEQLDNQAGFLENLKSMNDKLESMTRARYTACMKAFGAQDFCLCLRDKLAGRLEFYDYISIVTRTKSQLNYDQLDDLNKRLIDGPNGVITVRDKCVKRLSDTP